MARQPSCGADFRDCAKLARLVQCIGYPTKSSNEAGPQHWSPQVSRPRLPEDLPQKHRQDQDDRIVCERGAAIAPAPFIVIPNLLRDPLIGLCGSSRPSAAMQHDPDDLAARQCTNGQLRACGEMGPEPS